VVEASILVDSSIWIEALAPRAPKEVVTILSALLAAKRAAVSEMIQLEVLAGAKSHKELEQFREDFASIHHLYVSAESWRQAEEIGFALGRRGLHVPAADLLIAAVALSHDVSLWHADRDFERIKQVMAGFKTYWFPQQYPPTRALVT